MESQTTFTHGRVRRSGQTRRANQIESEKKEIPRPRSPRRAFKLQGVESGDISIDGPLRPTMDGQREVIVASLQKTKQGPGIAHVILADNPLGRTYPISARYLPEEALIPFKK